MLFIQACGSYFVFLQIQMSLATHLTSIKGFPNVNIFAAETLQMSLASKQTIQNMSKIIPRQEPMEAYT